LLRHKADIRDASRGGCVGNIKPHAAFGRRCSRGGVLEDRLIMTINGICLKNLFAPKSTEPGIFTC
jgi:hypothetical protein